MLIPKEFRYLRHGQTDWNLQHKAQGQTDVPLNATGIRQAHLAGASLRGSGIAVICSSPLDRAYTTASIIGEAIGAPLVVIDSLKEACWGSCEGQIKGKWYSDWKKGINPLGAEPYRDFIARALDGINQSLAQPGPVLIVAHGGVYWSIQEHARLDADSDIPNCTPVLHTPPSGAALPWSVHVASAINQ